MKDLVATKLSKNPRIAQAKSLIQAALRDAKNEITQVVSPQEDRQLYFMDLASRCSEARGGNIYYPYLGSGIGNGSLVELEDGSVKYDFITGIGVHYFGHSNEEIVMRGIQVYMQVCVWSLFKEKVVTFQVMRNFLKPSLKF